MLLLSASPDLKQRAPASSHNGASCDITHGRSRVSYDPIILDSERVGRYEGQSRRQLMARSTSILARRAVAGLALMALLVTACTNGGASTPQTSRPPQIPPESSFVMDFSAFKAPAGASSRGETSIRLASFSPPVLCPIRVGLMPLATGATGATPPLTSGSGTSSA